MENLEASLRDGGWFVKSEVIAEISSRTGHSDVSVIHFELLNLDLRKRGYGILPKDILSQEAGRIKGPAIVQVSEAETCPLSTQTAPGTKLLIKDATIEQGLIVLDAASIQVLGGRVDNLADAWEAQRKYSGVKRMTKADINSMGPVFSPFDPSRKTQSVKGSTGMHIPANPTTSTGTSAGTAQQAPIADPAKHENASGVGSKPPAGHAAKRDPPAGTAAASSLANAAKVKEKLQEKMSLDAAAYGHGAAEARAGGRGGRGRGRGRRGRRWDNEADDTGVMTMEEWEARQAGRAAPQGHHIDSDEQLARQLQAQLNAEAAEEARERQPRGRGAVLAKGPFPRTHSNDVAGSRRGRGGRRGGRARGHGR